MDNAVIMIDEPELSMHPKWASKILEYYKKLFFTEGKQKAQIIVATHSVHVLKNGLNDKNDTLVMVLEENNGLIECKRVDTPNILPSITIAETSYLDFDMVSNDYHIHLYEWLQEKEKLYTVLACDQYIKNHPEYIKPQHEKNSYHRKTKYVTLCTYIRNAIHHPNENKTFEVSELRASIELLIKICK